MQKALRLFVIVLFLVITVAAATNTPAQKSGKTVYSEGMGPIKPTCDPGTPGCGW